MNCRSLQPQPCIFQISKRGQVIWQISCIGEENDNMFCLFWSICSQFSWWQSLWEDVQWNGDEFLLLPWFDAEWWPSLHCSLQITHLEMTICFNQATRLFIIISNAGATIFEMEPQFLKNATPHEKKVSLTPQKSENEVPQKSLSPNPLWHVHFAKNQVQFGIFWPLEPHFWSTPPYRGSPPCAIFPIPDTKKYSTAMC